MLHAMALFGGNKTSRYAKAAEKYRAEVDTISDLADAMAKLSDAQLKERATQYRGKSYEELTKHRAEIFAAVREASERVLEMRHFDVQLLGGLALLDKTICEMKTGEGKTLVATLPLILHGLVGKGAHLVTVNDYLATRDAEWMQPLYEFFGLTVGAVVPGMSPAQKREAYAADITYGTNNEYGFDYLRDNMAARAEDLVQRPLAFGIVDEVDSILIDEARTPLIISAPDAESTASYERFSKIVPQLTVETDYTIDEKRKAASLTDDGITKVEGILGIENIYAENGIREVHHLEQALRAQTIYFKDKDYVVKDGQVIIIDEFTGRMMEGRRYAEGLHQAIEAKEGVAVQQESRTLATITFQNYFRLYKRLAGMTGTAVTSAEEFEKVYNLDVIVIPTNKELTRIDKPDRIYMTEAAKFKACAEEIRERQKKGQPVLVGTVAIEKSEYLSKLLSTEGITHEVLNAKHHQREAEIIAKAGALNSVTISTNMAGRGTDIKLGEGVAKAGGLFVLGTERHEARRIDHQLRGRSGRQGDPGETQFFVSMEDDVMRVFGGERMKGIMQKLRVPEGEAIENKLVNKTLEGAQERVEGYYFDMRKQVLSYDDVLNKQRNAIYTLRRGVLLDNEWRETGADTEPVLEHVEDLIGEQVDSVVAAHTGEGEPEMWDLQDLAETVHALTATPISDAKAKIEAARDSQSANSPAAAQAAIEEVVEELLTSRFKARADEFGGEVMGGLAQAASMRAIDTHWMEHLDTMDYLRTGIGLRGYGQRDPLVEYQKEGFHLFNQLLQTIKATIVETVFKATPTFTDAATGRQVPVEAQRTSGAQEGSALHQLAQQAPAQTAISQAPPAGANEAVPPEAGPITKKSETGRNDPCPCGSGLKYKKCGLINSPKHKG
ncbi:preprotein translocase subunit SecA [bacterium]|nr:preprotein translocase subunit SecA [bacterium]